MVGIDLDICGCGSGGRCLGGNWPCFPFLASVGTVAGFKEYEIAIEKILPARIDKLHRFDFSCLPDEKDTDWVD
jgi:hypothetical protein